jgi:hypothetical protein
MLEFQKTLNSPVTVQPAGGYFNYISLRAREDS